MKDKNECGSNGQNSVDNVALQESFGRSTLRSEFDGKYESTRYLSERRREYSGDAKRRQRYPCAVSTLTEIDAKYVWNIGEEKKIRQEEREIASRLMLWREY
ncbi:hypothetical protein PV326_012525 [Microctonus aethiopoides]|nr:hypothetical protein PV326_012525 [Microctonus aethiopoides]